MKKTILWLTVVVVSISMLSMISLAGCKEAAEEEAAEEEQVEEAAEEEVMEEEAAEEEVMEEEAAEEKVWTIGFNNFRDTHEFCAKVHQSIEDAAEKYGVELLYAEADMDGAVMITNTQTFIDRGVDLIIDFNWVPEVGATMLEMCNEAGVKLISMDAVYEGTYYFGADSYKAAQVLAEYAEGVMVEKWGGQLEALVGLVYLKGGDIIIDRVTGVEEYLRVSENIQWPSGMTFKFNSEGEQTLDAKNNVTDFLTAHPDLHHILIVSMNDETGAGAFAGIEVSERQEHCLAVSHGADTPFQEHIRAGGGDVWIASVAYAPETYGDQVIPMAIDILEGKDVPMFMGLDHYVVTKDNLDEYYPQ